MTRKIKLEYIYLFLTNVKCQFEMALDQIFIFASLGDMVGYLKREYVWFFA